MEHDIIFDLLPLYHDGVCSAASRAAVEAHLKACGTCREALLEMDAPLPAAEEQKNAADGAVVKGISEAWKKEKRKARLKGAAIAAAVCLLLGVAGVGCAAFVYGGTIHGAMEKLLEEGDYTRASKARSGILGAVSACYWLLVTAIYLYCIFGPSGNGNGKYTWYIWAIAGVLYGAVMMAAKLIAGRKTR